MKEVRGASEGGVEGSTNGITEEKGKLPEKGYIGLKVPFQE